MKFYYFISQALSPMITGGFYVYSRLLKTPRARVVVRNENEEILLLQAWPDTSRWGLPGGGMRRGERPEKAAAREMREEVGMELPAEKMTRLMTLSHQGHQELVYSAAVTKDQLPAVPPNRWEVKRAGWFSPDSLPEVLPATRHILAEVAGKR